MHLIRPLELKGTLPYCVQSFDFYLDVFKFTPFLGRLLIVGVDDDM